MRWEQYLEKSKEHGLLKLSVLILTLGIVAEGFFLIKLSQQQRIVLVPPGMNETQEAWVSEKSASAEYLEQMTRFLLPQLTNFHPGNIEVQLPLFLRYVAPEQYGAVKAQLQSQADRARRNELSQVFYIQQVEVKDQTARATGILRRFVGKTQVTEEVSTYEISYEIRHGRPVVVGIDLVPPAGMGASNHNRP